MDTQETKLRRLHYVHGYGFALGNKALALGGDGEITDDKKLLRDTFNSLVDRVEALHTAPPDDALAKITAERDRLKHQLGENLLLIATACSERDEARAALAEMRQAPTPAAVEAALFKVMESAESYGVALAGMRDLHGPAAAKKKAVDEFRALLTRAHAAVPVEIEPQKIRDAVEGAANLMMSTVDRITNAVLTVLRAATPDPSPEPKDEAGGDDVLRDYLEQGSSHRMQKAVDELARRALATRGKGASK